MSIQNHTKTKLYTIWSINNSFNSTLIKPLDSRPTCLTRLFEDHVVHKNRNTPTVPQVRQPPHRHHDDVTFEVVNSLPGCTGLHVSRTPKNRTGRTC